MQLYGNWMAFVIAMMIYQLSLENTENKYGIGTAKFIATMIYQLKHGKMEHNFGFSAANITGIMTNPLIYGQMVICFGTNMVKNIVKMISQLGFTPMEKRNGSTTVNF